jgi:hypothetical protein
MWDCGKAIGCGRSGSGAQIPARQHGPETRRMLSGSLDPDLKTLGLIRQRPVKF